MRLTLTSEQSRFSRKVNKFILAYWSPRELELLQREEELSNPLAMKQRIKGWYQEVFDEGWALLGWPEHLGGVIWDPVLSYIWLTECARRRIPTPQKLPGVSVVGPLLAAHGSNHQVDQFLPGIRQNLTSWALGFPIEPNERSTFEVVKGEGFLVLNGFTRCSFLGEECRYAVIFTQFKGRECALLVDLSEPMIEIHSTDSDGLSKVLCEVAFFDVKVPMDNVILAEETGEGPLQDKLFDSYFFFLPASSLRLELQNVKACMDNYQFSSVTTSKYSGIEVELEGLETLEQRLIFGQEFGSKSLSISDHLGIKTRELAQNIAQFHVELVGYDSIRALDPLLNHNEHPLAPKGSEYAVSKLLYINAWFGSPVSSFKWRDRLARNLKIIEKDESGTGDRSKIGKL